MGRDLDSATGGHWKVVRPAEWAALGQFLLLGLGVLTGDRMFLPISGTNTGFS